MALSSRPSPTVRGRLAGGFTLIEVLVAFSILAISAGALLVAFSTGIRHSALARDYTRAVVLAESRLAEMGVVELLVAGEQEGEIDDRYTWRTEVSEYQVGAEDSHRIGALQPYRVAVRVDWETLGQSRSVALTSLRLGRGE